MAYGAEDPTPPPATGAFGALQASYGGGMPSAGSGAPGAGATTTTPSFVYLGSRHYVPPRNKFSSDMLGVAPVAPYDVPKVDSIDEALSKFDRMTIDEQRKWLRLLAIGGFAGAINLENVDEWVKDASLQEARAAYENLLVTASDALMNSPYARSGDPEKWEPYTPENILRSSVAFRLKNAGVKWDGNLGSLSGEDGLSKTLEPLKPKTITNTSKSIDFMNPMDAKNLVRTALQQELGRDPTQGEYEDFLAVIHAAERENPSVTTTTQHYVPNAEGTDYDLASSKTVTHGGMGAGAYEQLAYEKARQQPGWAEWQAMGTYAPALYAALGATVPGV